MLTRANNRIKTLLTLSAICSSATRRKHKPDSPRQTRRWLSLENDLRPKWRLPDYRIRGALGA